MPLVGDLDITRMRFTIEEEFDDFSTSLNEWVHQVSVFDAMQKIDEKEAGWLALYDMFSCQK